MTENGSALKWVTNQRVLVCDAEQHIVRLIQVNLERQGFQVTCTSSGSQALENLLHGAFDRVIISFHLPELEGYEVLKWIRTHEPTRNLHVTMLTEKEQENERGTWHKLPYQADLYLAKPFNPADLTR